MAHIIRHHSGMCLIEDVTRKQKEEWECNGFAGNFLAPAYLIEPASDLKTISQYSSKLKVSREVYLGRLKEENGWEFRMTVREPS